MSDNLISPDLISLQRKRIIYNFISQLTFETLNAPWLQVGLFLRITLIIHYDGNDNQIKLGQEYFWIIHKLLVRFIMNVCLSVLIFTHFVLSF